MRPVNVKRTFLTTKIEDLEDGEDSDLDLRSTDSYDSGAISSDSEGTLRFCSELSGAVLSYLD